MVANTERLAPAGFVREPVHAFPASIIPLHTAVPGRVRLRVGGLRGAPAVRDLLERGLAAMDGVGNVSASMVTGNVTVEYENGTSLDHITTRIDGLLRGEISIEAHRQDLASQSATVADLEKELGTSCCRGLSGKQAAERLLAAGRNVLPALKQRSEFNILVGQFQSWPVGLLAGAAVLSIATGGLLEAAAILAVVALNGAIGFSTERRAERTIESLGVPAPLVAHVVRDEVSTEIPAETLVPGDLIALQRGMIVPADAQLVSARALTVSEAALSGESLPITKSVEPQADTPRLTRSNMVYRGTIVTGGSGSAIVVATGLSTQIGRIQQLVGDTIQPETPMQRQLAQLGTQLVWATLAASGTVFGLGWLRGFALLQLIRTSLSVAVAAVPEGLPMVATTALALGVENMRRRGILVRKLHAIETLAAVDVICFDKTGTLTHGSMSAEVVAVADHIWRAGSQQPASLQQTQNRCILKLLEIASLCSETEVEEDSGRTILSGSPTENALVQAAIDCGINVAQLRQYYPRHSIQYRTEAYRFMASAHASEYATLIAVKGSPREVLERCSREYLKDGRAHALTPQRRFEIEHLNARLADQALRVLGFAYSEHPERPNGPGNELALNDLTWIGLVGLADPVRPGMRKLMAGLHRAGIQTIMLTGDQSATARAVADQIGLSPTGDNKIVDAAGLDRLTAAELRDAARRAHAFARISPGQKLRVVRALQDTGATVAMMGDGINDSPALRAANVGIAVGQDESAAAREIADVFLATDDMTSLLEAIEQGRSTYANVRKAIHYILSTNTSEILLMLAGTAAGSSETLSPMQLLWINLISDPLPAIGLAMEAPDADVMERAPESAAKPIVQPHQLGRLAAEAAVLAGGPLGAGLSAAIRHGFTGAQTRTVTFGSLVIAQLLHAMTCRSPQRVFEAGAGPHNPALFAIVAGSLAIQAAGFLVPGIGSMFGIARLGALDLLVMLGGGILPLLINEARKGDQLPTEAASLRFKKGRHANRERETNAGLDNALIRPPARISVPVRMEAGENGESAVDAGLPNATARRRSSR